MDRDRHQHLIDALPLNGPLAHGSAGFEPPCLAAGSDLNRRAFLKRTAAWTVAAACAGPLLSRSTRQGLAAEPDWGDEERFVIEARHYEKQPHKKIRCVLCPRECVIDDRERGYCGVRENREGTYYTLVHSRACTWHADPIEKKPFNHVLPATLSFSLSTAGCNVNCKFCQNWQISQARPEQIRSLYIPPEAVARMALENDCRSVAYTYGEPVIYFEYMLDAAAAVREAGLKNVVVTGGYISTRPLQELCANVDAIKVDLKSYSEEYYRKVVNGELKPVLDALVTMRNAGTWIEIVYLVVPTLNDSDEEFTGLCRWIARELGPDVPIHFTRFHPDYLLKHLPPTPATTLRRAKDIGDAEGLHYVYLGNVPGDPAENTHCHHCGDLVIRRQGFFVTDRKLDGGKCGHCGQQIPGIWSA